MEEDDKTPLLNASDHSDSVLSNRHSSVPYNRKAEVTNNQYGQYDTNTVIDRQVQSQSQTSLSSVEVDSVLAIFVVAFDTRSGNVVEWCVPEDTDLDGVEFKAMASGSHTLMKDFVYFKKDNVYGLACFENMPVESDLERGARMKSVGILSPSFITLHKHKEFLETQVRHQLEIPGRYEQLYAFYEDNKGVLPSSLHSADCNSNSSVTFSIYSQLTADMKITHPSGGFSHFLKFFGENVFTLWKFALLQKRILFFSPPPIGVVCFRVYATCCLAHHNIRGLGGLELKPHFYVNVADIETLETEMAFVACTTEKIFESKKNLFDVYVDNQNITSHIPIFKELLHVTDADKDWLKRLNNIRTERLYPNDNMNEESYDDEQIITDFFTDLNDRIFQTLIDVSLTQDKQLTSEHIRNMGLDPTGDRTFLMELLEHYGIDVVLMVDNPCCPK